MTGQVEAHDQDHIYLHEPLARDSGLIVNLHHMTYDVTAQLYIKTRNVTNVIQLIKM